eukprot:1479236-Pleurochrysis_carterae.AAC.1
MHLNYLNTLLSIPGALHLNDSPHRDEEGLCRTTRVFIAKFGSASWMAMSEVQDEYFQPSSSNHKHWSEATVPNCCGRYRFGHRSAPFQPHQYLTLLQLTL